MDQREASLVGVEMAAAFDSMDAVEAIQIYLADFIIVGKTVFPAEQRPFAQACKHFLKAAALEDHRLGHVSPFCHRLDIGVEAEGLFCYPAIVFVVWFFLEVTAVEHELPVAVYRVEAERPHEDTLRVEVHHGVIAVTDDIEDGEFAYLLCDPLPHRYRRRRHIAFMTHEPEGQLEECFRQQFRLAVDFCVCKARVSRKQLIVLIVDEDKMVNRVRHETADALAEQGALIDVVAVSLCRYGYFRH